MSTTNKRYLVIPASGVGSRMGADKPKQYLTLNNGLSILDQTLSTLLEMDEIDGCVIAISNQDQYFQHSTLVNHPKILKVVAGGKERFHSVINALEGLQEYAGSEDWVLVHDAARPCVDPKDVKKLINTLKNHAVGGILAIPAVDTIKQVNANQIEKTLDRSQLWQAQTPQMYRFGLLLEALNQALAAQVAITDEAGSIEHLGLESLVVESSKKNLKITTTEDLALANFYLAEATK